MTALADPEFLPFKLDLVARRVLVVRLDAAARRAAAFLDERALPPKAEGGWVPLESWLANTAGATRAADAIFHIGHCGSTLLSRLLDAWPELHNLREPLPLRTLAEAWPQRAQPTSRLSPADAERVLSVLWQAWSRPLQATRSSVKATSSCNGLIVPLLAQQPAMRAVLLDMPLRPYLATLLKSPDSVRDAASAAPERLHDLHLRGYGEELFLHALSLPQQCAMGWLAERVRFHALAREYDGRVLRVNFETLLAHPEASLTAVARHFALDPAGIAAALAAPAWQRYSKAQDHGYGADDRAHDLALAAQRHAQEIVEAERWLDGFVQRHAVVADAVA